LGRIRTPSWKTTRLVGEMLPGTATPMSEAWMKA